MIDFDFVTANDDSLQGALKKLKDDIWDQYGNRDWAVLNCFSFVQMKVIPNPLGGQPAMMPIFHVTALLIDETEDQAFVERTKKHMEFQDEIRETFQNVKAQQECVHDFGEMMPKPGGSRAYGMWRKCKICGFTEEL